MGVGVGGGGKRHCGGWDEGQSDLRRIPLVVIGSRPVGKGSHGFFPERLLATTGNGDFLVVAEGAGVDVFAA